MLFTEVIITLQKHYLVLVIALFIATGCKSDINSRIVNMPPLPQELSLSISSICKMKNAEFKVLGSDIQELSFLYRECFDNQKLDFTLDNQKKVLYKDRPIIVVDNIRDHTPQSYMEAMASNAPSDTCFAVETPENLWLLIHIDVSPKILPEVAESLYPTGCGKYGGAREPKGWVFAFKDDIVFGFKQENVRNLIELSSIRYTEILSK